MQLKLQKILVIDTSSLIALERVGILSKLTHLSFQITIPKIVSLEFGKIGLENVKIESLRGRSAKKANSIAITGFGKGEAECLVLANKLKTGFIICDDRKLLRQKYLLEDKILEEIEIAGFSFILHLLLKKGQLNGIWDVFNAIVEKNNWKGSEVEAANFVFLKEIGY